MELAGSTRYRWVVHVHHSRGFRRRHYEGIRPVFTAGVCLRHASTSLRYRSGVRVARVSRVPAHDRRVSSTSRRVPYSLLQTRRLVHESRYSSVFHSLKATLVPFSGRSSRYVLLRVSRYLLSKQWVPLTRESALKFPLTASIQAEFNIRAGISVYQQSSVRRQRVCRHREDSIFLLLTIQTYCSDVEEKKNFFFFISTSLSSYMFDMVCVEPPSHLLSQ